MTGIRNICLLGFGEVGITLAQELAHDHAGNQVMLKTYDHLFVDANSAPSKAALQMPFVTANESAEEAAKDCQLIISAVTADQCIAAAESVVPVLVDNAWYLDLNSVSPGSKRQAAQLIIDENGRYVESAVMGPIQPLGVATPMLLGGPHANAFLRVATDLGFKGARVFAEELGQASAAKMCRSVIIKGMEALVTESLVAARHYGVEESVIDSLHNFLPGVDWSDLSRYMINRTLVHGKRRAEEMQQVAETLTEAGIEPLMSDACAARQAMAPVSSDATDEPHLAAMLDRILGRESSPRGIPNANH